MSGRAPSDYRRDDYRGGSRDGGYGGGGGRARSRSRSRERGGGSGGGGGGGGGSSGAAGRSGRGSARSRSRSRERGGCSPQHLSKEEEELLQLTRDARTIFVSQLVVRASDRDVREFMEQIGPVVDVQLIRDRSTLRSKGFGYVEFEDLDSVPKALLLNGQNMCMKHAACSCSGFPIAVKPSEVRGWGGWAGGCVRQRRGGEAARR